MAARLANADLAHAVESNTLRNHHFRSRDPVAEIRKIRHFDEQSRTAAANTRGRFQILFQARFALKHDLRRTFLENDKGELVCRRNLNGFLKSEAFHPERQTRLNLIDKQYWGDFHVP